MGFISFTLLFFSCFLLYVHCDSSSAKPNTRVAIEVIIGGGVGVGIGVGGANNTINCPPPPLQPQSPPPQSQPPPPLTFADSRLAAVYPVIQTFKNRIISDPFSVTATWVGADICNYRGFYCDAPPDNASATALASIDFNGFQLSAPTLDNFLEKLPDLALFHANSNNFTGSISPKIATLPYLYELDISNNKFTGSFPSALLAPNNITFLDIRFNFFSGSVPAQIFTRPLDVLFINNNNFAQSLPETIGNTPVLYLTLANNKFSGPIPPSIGKASGTLMEILLLNNELSGCLPYEIGYLKELTVFDVGGNFLTGPIPCSFGCLEKMELMNLAGNLLYGHVPELLCALGSVTNLSLSDNYFTFVGPICRGLIKRGVLDLRKNCVHDLPFQRSAIECAKFFACPRFCGHTAWFNFVPCKPSRVWGRQRRSRGGEERRPLTSSFAKMRSPSYAALEKHRT